VWPAIRGLQLALIAVMTLATIDVHVLEHVRGGTAEGSAALDQLVAAKGMHLAGEQLRRCARFGDTTSPCVF
jgi:hypothetical protein